MILLCPERAAKSCIPSIECFRIQSESIAELFAALGAAAGQNLAAVGGGHPLAEAVLLLCVTLLGLIGTLCHVLVSPFKS